MDKLRQEVEELRSEILTLAEKPGDLEAAEQERYDAALAEFETKRAALDAAEKRAEKVAEVRQYNIPGQRTVERSQGPEVIVKRDAFAVLEDRSLVGKDRTRALVDGLLRANEERIDGADHQRNFEKIVKRHARDTAWAENILLRSRDVYAEAFAMVLGGDRDLLSDAQRAALAVGTNTQGGYLVPTHLDPSLMITNSGSENELRQYASVKTLTVGNVWKGITTAGVTASFDAELTEVSDDTWAPEDETISTHMGRAFVQASVQAVQDIANLQSDTLTLFMDAKDRLEGSKFMTGSGSGEPLGLFTAINASSSLKTTSTTAATIGEVDLHALYRSLPKRWRGRGTFVANPLYTLAVKRLGTAVSSSYSGDLTQPVAERWIGRPVLESDDAPTTQTTTALDQEIAFADLSNFVIVDLPGGTSVEYIPHLFNTTTNLPDSRRGWIMFWRTGSGFPNLVAGRLLVDKTSA